MTSTAVEPVLLPDSVIEEDCARWGGECPMPAKWYAVCRAHCTHRPWGHLPLCDGCATEMRTRQTRMACSDCWQPFTPVAVRPL